MSWRDMKRMLTYQNIHAGLYFKGQRADEHISVWSDDGHVVEFDDVVHLYDNTAVWSQVRHVRIITFGEHSPFIDARIQILIKKCFFGIGYC